VKFPALFNAEQTSGGQGRHIAASVALDRANLLIWKAKITEAWLDAVSAGDDLERRNQEQALLFLECRIDLPAHDAPVST
jgi:hypothetical protein